MKFTHKKKQWLKNTGAGLWRIGNRLLNVLRHYASWISFLKNISSSLLARIPLAVLRATSYIAPFARIISGLNLLTASLPASRSKWTRALSLLASVAGILLGLAAFLWPAFSFSFALASISSNALLGAWFLAVALKNKYIGPWKQQRESLKKKETAFYTLLSYDDKLEKFKCFRNKDRQDSQDEMFILAEMEQTILRGRNRNNELNADLSIKVYNMGIILIALAGMILTFFPSTLILGAGLLLATSVHGILFGYDLAGKWPEQVQHYFFAPCKEESEETLAKKVAAHKQTALYSTATTQQALQNQPRLRAKNPLLPVPRTLPQEKPCDPSINSGLRANGFIPRKKTAPFLQPSVLSLDIMPTF